ncbi:MAG: amino acid synthesis family protein, partial [Deltaproteobacteria bacterium]
VRLPDAPMEDELVLIVVVTDAGRPAARVGGLKKEDAKCEDGLR